MVARLISTGLIVLVILVVCVAVVYAARTPSPSATPLPMPSATPLPMPSATPTMIIVPTTSVFIEVAPPAIAKPHATATTINAAYTEEIAPPAIVKTTLPMIAIQPQLPHDISPDPVTAYVPLLSLPRATSAQAIRYIMQRGTTYSHEEITHIVERYWHISFMMGIDPLLVVAQAIHESDNFRSWWAQPPRNNPAGLLVTGERRSRPPPDEEQASWFWDESRGVWWRGLRFASWDESISYHVGLLLAYALRDEKATTAQYALIHATLDEKPFPSHYRGCAASLHALNGKWAVPGYGYGQAIATIAEQIRTTNAAP